MTEQTQPTDALLPCPFCGAAAHFEMDEGRWEWVECESCEMQGNRSASLMDDCKPKLAEEWNRRTPPAVAPWRSAVLDLIDDCPGLTLEQDHWLSRRVKELDFATTPQPTQAQAGAVPLPQYRLLEPRVDRIEAEDEFLQDNAQTWATDPNGTFVGTIYGYALRAARRRIKGADHG